MPILTSVRSPLVSFGTGFARGPAESAHPELWKKLSGFWAPQLGPTGDRLIDYGPYGHHAEPMSGSSIDWRPGPLGWNLEVNEDSWRVLNSATTRYRFGTSDFTVFAAGRSDGGPAGTTLICKDNSNNQSPVNEEAWSLQVNGSGTVFEFRCAGGTLGSTAPSTRADGLWHCYVGLRDGAEGRFYLDGVLEHTLSTYFSGLSLDGDHDLQFAARQGARTTGEWIGGIGPFAIWHRALSDAEIRLLYRDPLAPLRRKKRSRVGFVAAGGTTYEESITLGANASAASVANAIMDAAISLATTESASSANVATINPVVTLDASVALGNLDVVTKEEVLALAVRSGMTTSEQLTAAATLALAIQQQVAAASNVIAEEALTIAIQQALAALDSLPGADHAVIRFTLEALSKPGLFSEALTKPGLFDEALTKPGLFDEAMLN